MALAGGGIWWFQAGTGGPGPGPAPPSATGGWESGREPRRGPPKIVLPDKSELRPKSWGEYWIAMRDAMARADAEVARAIAMANGVTPEDVAAKAPLPEFIVPPDEERLLLLIIGSAV